MNFDDFSAPTGPQGLTELSEARLAAKIDRQCEIWQNYALDPEWIELVKWWVTYRKDKMPSWRERWCWSDEYWPAGGELDYKAWFEAVQRSDDILPIQGLLDVAVHARKRYEGSVEMRGPLKSEKYLRPGAVMSQEHANSYTVDTGGIKELVAKITGKNKNKYGRSTEHKVVDLQILAVELAERVGRLENSMMLTDKGLNATEKLTNRVLHNEEQLMFLQDRARQDAMKMQDLSKNVREITHLLVNIQAWQKQTQKALAVLLQNSGPTP
jgi:hypothetical protein